MKPPRPSELQGIKRTGNREVMRTGLQLQFLPIPGASWLCKKGCRLIKNRIARFACEKACDLL